MGRARAVARAVRTWLVRSLHPWRRRRAHRLLEEAVPVEHVLFVCLGNVCRSPYAERRLLTMLAAGGSSEPGPEVGSSGFIKPGRGSPERAVEMAAERGVGLEEHVSRVLADSPVRETTLVAVMEPGQVRGVRRELGVPTRRVLVLGDLDPEPPRRRLIRDPWGQEPDVFRSSFDRIDRCLAELLPYLGRGR